MPKTKIGALLFAFAFVSVALFAQESEMIEIENPNNFYEVQKAANAYFESIPVGEKKSGYKQYKRWEYFMKARLNPDGTFGNPKQVLDVYQNTMEISKNLPTLQGNYNWKLIGPVVVPEPPKGSQSSGIGRINAVELHPTNPNEIWVATAGGGLWKSVDNGKNWKQSFPDEKFFTMGSSDISISESNPSIIYAATGDSYGIGSGGAVGYHAYSIGVIKSTNGGDSWEATGMFKETKEQFRITRIICHKKDPNSVLAGTSRGIFKTTDGGATWNRASATANFYDLEVKPDDPNTVYASCFYSSKIYKTTDFGSKWKQVQAISGSKRTELAVSDDDPEVVAAVTARDDGGFNSFWLSFDAGESWEKISDRESAGNILGWQHDGKPEGKNSQGQGWYDLALEIDPKDYSHIIVGGINLWETNDGGNSFDCITEQRGHYQLPCVHPDFHDLNWSKDGSTLYMTNDGGIYKSSDLHNFEDISDGMPITQYYWFGSANSDPTWMLAGAQDNNTVGKKGDKWKMFTGGDGVACMIDPENKDNWYSSYVNGVMYRSQNAGDNYELMINAESVEKYPSDWVTPMTLDPTSPNKVYVGFRNVWLSTKYGEPGSWTRIYNFKHSPYENLVNLRVYGNTIVTSTNQKLYISYNGGNSFEKINIDIDYNSISDVALDVTTPGRFWFSVNGFNDGKKVFEYYDADGKGGEKGTLTNISGNLPNIPVNAIGWQKNSPDRLYIGTDIGVYVSEYSSGVWKRFGTGFPNSIVSRVEILDDHDLIRVSTYGRGLWEAPLNKCNLEQPHIEADGETTICEGEAVTLRVTDDITNFTWSTGETTKEITVTESGYYSIEYVDGDCSVNSNSILVDVIEVDSLEITGKKESAFCENQNTEVTLVATPGFTKYEWNTGGTGKKITVTETGTYSVKATSKEGCVVETSFEVIETAPPAEPTIYQQSWLLSCSSDEAVAWKWYKQKTDGSWKPLFSEKEQTLKLDTNDIKKNFKVEIFDKYGCMASAEYYVESSVKDLNSDEYVHVVPNPVENVANLEMNITQPGPIEIMIFDINGKIVYNSAELSNGSFLSTQVNMSNFAAGTYILNIKSGERSYSTTIIRQ